MTLRLAFGDFDLDEARFELRLRGQPVLVQPKVLDLICYLARHRERVVTKDELLETVWKGIAVTEASLSQAVSLARRALEDTAEDQHTIRTVRSKGLQFVAPERVGARSTTPGHRPTPPRGNSAGLTQMETVQDESVPREPRAEEPYLFAALHCEAPCDGGEAWSLSGVDEVEVGRGSERRGVRKTGVTRVLAVSVPGRLMSRRHARFVRTPHGWIVVDENSRNGTYVNGERVERHSLAPGDVIDCGRTLFRFTTERVASEDATPPTDATDGILGTVTPRLRSLERDLVRIATSDVSVLLLGEHGVGKTHLAQALHRASGRRGALLRLDASGSGTDEGNVLSTDPGLVSLLIENVDRIGDAALAKVRRVLEASEDVRVFSTTTLPAAALRDRIPTDVLTRLGTYTCELPPLRERVGDIGVLAARIWAGSDPSLEIEIAAGRAMIRHDWPGNLRELSQRLKVAATLSAGEPMRAMHLFPETEG